MRLTPEVEAWVGELRQVDERLRERAEADLPEDVWRGWTGWKGNSRRLGGVLWEGRPHTDHEHHEGFVHPRREPAVD